MIHGRKWLVCMLLVVVLAVASGGCGGGGGSSGGPSIPDPLDPTIPARPVEDIVERVELSPTEGSYYAGEEISATIYFQKEIKDGVVTIISPAGEREDLELQLIDSPDVAGTLSYTPQAAGEYDVILSVYDFEDVFYRGSTDFRIVQRLEPDGINGRWRLAEVDYHSYRFYIPNGTSITLYGDGFEDGSDREITFSCSQINEYTYDVQTSDGTLSVKRKAPNGQSVSPRDYIFQRDFAGEFRTSPYDESTITRRQTSITTMEKGRLKVIQDIRFGGTESGNEIVTLHLEYIGP